MNKVIVAFDSDNDPKEPIRLKLVTLNDCVILQAVDRDGKRIIGGDILSIRPNGVRLMEGVRKGIGLSLDIDGKVVVRDNRL